jgi:hypothetical protein
MIVDAGHVGDFVVELHLDEADGHRLKLRSLIAGEEEGGLVVGLREVRPVAEVLLGAVGEGERLAQDLDAGD